MATKNSRAVRAYSVVHQGRPLADFCSSAKLGLMIEKARALGAAGDIQDVVMVPAEIFDKYRVREEGEGSVRVERFDDDGELVAYSNLDDRDHFPLIMEFLRDCVALNPLPVSGWRLDPFRGAPEWAEYATFDAAQTMEWWEFEPVIASNEIEWMSPGRRQTQSTNVQSYGGEWTDSKIRRGEYS